MNPRVLCLGAHPDDIELGCGATAAKLAAEGHEVFFAILTSGEAGSIDIAPTELAGRREAEARASAEILGARDVSFMRYPDGLMHATREMKVELIRLVRRLRPGMVFVHGREDRFPDHRIVHDLAVAAVGAAAGPWYAEAGGAAHEVASVLGYEVWNPISQPGLFVGVANTIDKKLDALRAHATQLETIRYDEAARGLARYRGAMSRRGDYAEAFELLRGGSLPC